VAPAGDLLSLIREHVIPETSTLQETISLILAGTQLLRARDRSVTAG